MKFSDKSIDRLLRVIPALGLALLFLVNIFLPASFFREVFKDPLFARNGLFGESSHVAYQDAQAPRVEEGSQAYGAGSADSPVDPNKPELFVLLERASPSDSQNDELILEQLIGDERCDQLYGPMDVRPLMLAAGNASARVVQALLNCGADANSANKDGSTALMYAASAGRLENVNLLLQAGADRHLFNNKIQTALDMATQQGYSAVVRALKEK